MEGQYRKCRQCGHAYRYHFALGGPCKVKVAGQFLGGGGRSHRWSRTRCDCPKFAA